jgi:hypothetical protein
LRRSEECYDGTERGLMFVFIGKSIRRQFEFVQSEWVNNGIFIGSGNDKDPIAGAGDDTGKFYRPTQTGPKELPEPASVRRHTRR